MLPGACRSGEQEKNSRNDPVTCRERYISRPHGQCRPSAVLPWHPHVCVQELNLIILAFVGPIDGLKKVLAEFAALLNGLKRVLGGFGEGFGEGFRVENLPQTFPRPSPEPPKAFPRLRRGVREAQLRGVSFGVSFRADFWRALGGHVGSISEAKKHGNRQKLDFFFLKAFKIDADLEAILGRFSKLLDEQK